MCDPWYPAPSLSASPPWNSLGMKRWSPGPKRRLWFAWMTAHCRHCLLVVFISVPPSYGAWSWKGQSTVWIGIFLRSFLLWNTYERKQGWTFLQPVQCRNAMCLPSSPKHVNAVSYFMEDSHTLFLYISSELSEECKHLFGASPQVKDYHMPQKEIPACPPKFMLWRELWIESLYTVMNMDKIHHSQPGHEKLKNTYFGSHNIFKNIFKRK